MAIAIDSGSSPRKTDIRYETAEVASGETSPWYILPNGLDIVSVELQAIGTAKIQATLDRVGAEKETPDAVGVDWENGDITAGNSQASVRGAVALRIVSTSGIAKAFITGVSD